MGTAEAGLALNVQQAVVNATAFMLELYPGKISNLLLEEVEMEGGSVWNITLSFTVLGEPATETVSVLPGVTQRLPPRHYKVIRVDAFNGKVLSMKIRKNV
jgi:hypothetical protein